MRLTWPMPAATKRSLAAYTELPVKKPRAQVTEIAVLMVSLSLGLWPSSLMSAL